MNGQLPELLGPVKIRVHSVTTAPFTRLRGIVLSIKRMAGTVHIEFEIDGEIHAGTWSHQNECIYPYTESAIKIRRKEHEQRQWE